VDGWLNGWLALLLLVETVLICVWYGPNYQAKTVGRAQRDGERQWGGAEETRT